MERVVDGRGGGGSLYEREERNKKKRDPPCKETSLRCGSISVAATDAVL
jgi:hypothetical protein